MNANKLQDSLNIGKNTFNICICPVGQVVCVSLGDDRREEMLHQTKPSSVAVLLFFLLFLFVSCQLSCSFIFLHFLASQHRQKPPSPSSSVCVCVCNRSNHCWIWLCGEVEKEKLVYVPAFTNKGSHWQPKGSLNKVELNKANRLYWNERSQQWKRATSVAAYNRQSIVCRRYPKKKRAATMCLSFFLSMLISTYWVTLSKRKIVKKTEEDSQNGEKGNSR